ncbi:MAG: HEAT repeat domain-containing protein [Caldilineaceae bacterium]
MTENTYEQTLAVAVDTGEPVLEREQAIHKLGESATPDVVDHLIKLLEDNEDGVRWAASSALIECGDAALAAPPGPARPARQRMAAPGCLSRLPRHEELQDPAGDGRVGQGPQRPGRREHHHRRRRPCIDEVDVIRPRRMNSVLP